MRVKFRVSTSDGLGRRFASGQVAEVDDATARTWLGLGLVQSAEPPTKREAVKRAPRTAASPRPDREG
jgi:hypothetical protein